MPPKTLRVHQLAKELGVNSKVIVAKCEAEGVPGITNHMSVVKLGLAATVREWFSEGAGDDHNAVETAEKVDLEKVRKPRRKAATKKKAAADDTVNDDSAAATATIEAPPKPKPKRKPKPKPTEPESADETVVQAPAEPEAPAEAPAPVEADAGPVQPAGVQNVPDRPDVVKPVGEQLEAPKKAKLAGPKVIRVEKPEPDRPPRPRRAGGGPSGGGGPRSGGGGGGGMAPGEVEGISRSRGPARGGGVRPGGGAPGGGDDRGNKRRSLNSRRGRSADALLTGPTQLSKADADELDARLKGSTGYMKQRRRDLRTKGTGGATGFQAQSAVQTGGKVEIEEPITIKGLSSATGIKTAQIVKFLFNQGVMASVNSAIGTEAAMEVAMEYNIELEVKELESAEEQVEKQFAEREKVDVQPRPPVVTVLGHVDHGKTSLLDRIRRADVADHEDGGITQHVGAYRVSVEGSDGDKKTVVFLDTPGHEAFSAMRARGAKMTDLVVLVVAADDGVMPTTLEAINHAKAAVVPMNVSLIQLDTPQATDENIRKIYGQLAEHGLNPVEWGGDTEIVKTSATEGTGVTE
ncbi:MAG: translation initiation factor IF-2 N-terminal domain-containing protein, partial [Planctomycetota bacterium]